MRTLNPLRSSVNFAKIYVPMSGTSQFQCADFLLQILTTMPDLGTIFHRRITSRFDGPQLSCQGEPNSLSNKLENRKIADPAGPSLKLYFPRLGPVSGSIKLRKNGRARQRPEICALSINVAGLEGE